MYRPYRKNEKAGTMVAGVRLSQAEHQRLQTMADAQTGGNASEWLRRAIARSWARFKVNRK